MTGLSKKQLQEKAKSLLCPEGAHTAWLTDFMWQEKSTGKWLMLKYKTDDHEVVTTLIYETTRMDLEGMNLNHQLKLISVIEGALGVDEIEDVDAALEDCISKPVSIEVYHRTDDDGLARAEIKSWGRAD